MPVPKSFAFDCWADRTLFHGGQRLVLEWLSEHRCSLKLSQIVTRWRVGPDITSIIYQCVTCAEYRAINTRTPFDLFTSPVGQYMQEGWPELSWDERLPLWQNQHRGCLGETGHFSIVRDSQSSRLSLAPRCPCGRMGPNFTWAPTREAPPIPTNNEPVFVPSPAEAPDPQASPGEEVLMQGRRFSWPTKASEHFVRHRTSGSVFRLPPLTLLLEYAGRREAELPTQAIPIEQIFDFEYFYPPKEGPTWFDRISRDDDD